MNPHIKIPPPARLPKGLIALARAPHLPEASTSHRAERRAIVEPEDATRAWKPDRDLLRAEPQPAQASAFTLAADEQTVIGATNLKDPSLFRSEPPPARTAEDDIGCDAHNIGWTAHEETTVDFVGLLTDLDRDEAQPDVPAACGEKTTLYKPQRLRVAPEEPTDPFEAGAATGEARVAGAEPPKVIIAPAVLAGAPDPARTEATKKRRARHADTKLGLGLCLLGGVALVLSAAWRHPRTAPVTHEAFTKVAAAVSSLHGK
jgi:hypothetical protein